MTACQETIIVGVAGEEWRSRKGETCEGNALLGSMLGSYAENVTVLGDLCGDYERWRKPWALRCHVQ